MSIFPSDLLAGYASFRQDDFTSQQARYQDLADKGQEPETMIIACCDSRAAPETIFNARPGEIFVTRNVANMVPPYVPDGQLHEIGRAHV